MNAVLLIPLMLILTTVVMTSGCGDPHALLDAETKAKLEAVAQVDQVCSLPSALVSNEACNLILAGAKSKGYNFTNPRKGVAQQEQSPKLNLASLEQTAQAHSAPALAKIASKQKATAQAWDKMTPRQRWEHYKTGHGLPEWDKLKDRERYQYYAKLVATHEGIPPNIFWAQLMQESGYNPKVCSHVGACGIGQFMPATARAMGLHDRTNPWESIHKAAKYMLLNKKRAGSWELALASYNAGFGAVQRYRGIPPYKETQNYVRIIMSAHKGN